MKSANLCWGHRYMWLRIHQLPPRHQHESHILMRFLMPAGLTAAGCRAILLSLTRRHEALRTTFPADGGPRQRVHAPGPWPIAWASVERDGTPSPAEVVEELSARPFDLAAEWPIRACVITSGGVPKQVVLVFNHLAVDMWTLKRIEHELWTQAEGVASRRPVSLGPVRHQPADLARWEATAEAAGLAADALAYWEKQVALLPADPFAARRRAAPPEEARHATLTSPSLLDAGRRIAARLKVWPSAVHLAAHTALLAAYTGQGAVGQLAFAGNRGSHAFQEVLTCMFSPMLMRVGCSDDPPFSELVRRVADENEQAARHAYVPYDEVVELVSREGSRRGEPVRLGSEVNFLNQRTLACGGRRTTFAWNRAPEAWAHYGADTYLRIDEWRDAVVLGLQAASSVMDAAAMEAFLRGHEALLLAHDDPDTDLRVSQVAELAGFDPAGPPAPPTPVPAAAEPAVQALTGAVCQVHGLAGVDPSDGYVLAGGRVLRAPEVLALLRERGWEGLTPRALAEPTPLAVLAGLLAPVRPSAAEPES
ncbi:condensation domain-containing protein [Nonomuraea sp. MCN248]|uniref:Condensation domain-containing protein n=1 Tax=Nonomuraea corallina TaxID=2989783 RepID=A0ABT4SIG9_9ACTN|nr:condensation domain-containing protein [Nonomuraea corallina]MDA0636997.1 condensation domain-containing protein [Nonomuraea corallina]